MDKLETEKKPQSIFSRELRFKIDTTALAICALFLASGVSALIFETLWFRQSRLLLGSSFWAQTLVPAAFMAGLGVGSTIAIRRGDRFARPLRVYAGLEVIVALSGVALVYLLPALESPLAPLLRALLNRPLMLGVARLTTAFVLLLAPSTAMGITLPLLTRALTRSDASFGRVLGRLYGWNTLGAVAGAMLSELLLIERLGIHGTALAAGALDLVAAIVALLLSSRVLGSSADKAESATRVGTRGVRRWFVVASLSGSLLLALEVIWFRFLSLYTLTSSLMFAVMLSIVLGGIAFGGFVASVWLRRAKSAHEYAGTVAFAAGALTIACYASSHAVLSHFRIVSIARETAMLKAGVPLMFPVSALSGILFALTGSALRKAPGMEARAAGLLTLWNTVGAALGALLAGFVLLPMVGMERSLLIVAVLYGVNGIFAISLSRGAVRVAAVVAFAAFAASVALFPFGSMRRDHMRAPISIWASDPNHVEIREGRTETIMYAERRFLGHTQSWRLITNAISMSGSEARNRRYMKAFVYLPVALEKRVRSALLISFGVGATARALTDTREIERIDIVDISRDILEMSRFVYPDEHDNPLRDPRVHVHVEDGRFFLRMTDDKFDLITAEPPPPAVDGVVNLYSREYFQLMRERLTERGIATYWLPLHALSEASAKNVIRAFCDAFDDCSLWHGMGLDFVMMGSRGASASGTVSEERFAAQWNEPRVASELSALGLEKPEQLGALFIGDATYLATLTDGALPVIDDFPARIVVAGPVPMDATHPLYAALTDEDAARARFRASPLIRRVWPAQMHRKSDDYFEAQRLINEYSGPRTSLLQKITGIHYLVTSTSLEAPILWGVGSDSDVQRVLRTLPPDELALPEAEFHRAAASLASRHFDDAARSYERAAIDPRFEQPSRLLRAYSLMLAGRRDDGNASIAAFDAAFRARADVSDFLAWLTRTFPESRPDPDATDRQLTPPVPPH